MAPIRPCAVLLLLVFINRGAAGTNHCMHYTWLGPAWQDTSSFDEDTTEDPPPGKELWLAKGTCSDVRPKPVPCVTPIIITSPGTALPSGRNLIETFGRRVQCVPAGGDVCAITAFYFRKQVVNVTAYCTHVSLGDSAFHSGCEAADTGAYTNVICACPPGEEPCNINVPDGAHQILASFMVQVLPLLVYLTNNYNNG